MPRWRSRTGRSGFDGDQYAPLRFAHAGPKTLQFGQLRRKPFLTLMQPHNGVNR
ncbi:hypothetical protein Bra1253DRAFT_06710 [Bradyrhizobium sp. WSM1253]|nr:hypothetical protein Bra1253DRAFT_06710 [Bradyrhizobium sp. WSM1253]